MRLLELRLPNGRTVLSAGIVTDGIRRFLALWIGTRCYLVNLNLRHAAAWRPGAAARW